MSLNRRLDYAEVHRLRGLGMTNQAIADHFDVTRGAIQYALHQSTEPERRAWGDAKYWDLWSQGYTVAQIARRCEVRQGVVQDALRERGIERLQLVGTERLKALLRRLLETVEEIESEMARREFGREEAR